MAEFEEVVPPLEMERTVVWTHLEMWPGGWTYNVAQSVNCVELGISWQRIEAECCINGMHGMQ